MNLAKEAANFTSRHLVGRWFLLDQPAFVVNDVSELMIAKDVPTSDVVGYLQNLPAEKFTIEWTTPEDGRKIVSVIELNMPMADNQRPVGDYVSIVFLEAGKVIPSSLVPEVIVSGQGLDIYQGWTRLDREAMLKEGVAEYANAAKDMTAFVLNLIKLIDEDAFDGYQLDEPVKLNKKRMKNNKCPIAGPIVLTIKEGYTNAN